MLSVLLYKVSGNILNLVLVVLIVSGGIIGSLLLLAYHRELLVTKHNLVEKLDTNAASGMKLILMGGDRFAELADYDLYGEGTDSVRLQQKPWGVYDLAVVQAHSGRHSRSLLALIGAELDSARQTALFLADEGRPLFIVDKATIKGKVFLPEAGLKYAAMAGSEIPGVSSVKGEIGISKTALPERYKAAFSRVRKHLNGELAGLAHSAFLQVPTAGGNQSNSFSNDTQVLVSDKDIFLQDVALSGNVVVYSNKAVVVGGTAKLKDIIVIAPFILVESGFKGSVQLIAQDSIIISANAKLEYPSALCLYNPEGKGKLVVGEECSITGDILAGTGAEPYNLLVISQGAVVQGQVFVEGSIEHYGTMEGGMFSRNLLLRTPGTLYGNYLKDGTIDAGALSGFYLTSAGVGANARKGVVKWVD